MHVMLADMELLGRYQVSAQVLV
eukprot:COSAG02_NODE_77092_length_128_cov_202.310345_1_plen_22_part_10